MKKLEALKGEIQKEEKKKTNVFCELKSFSSCYFFIIHFSLHFKDDFLSLQ